MKIRTILLSLVLLSLLAVTLPGAALAQEPPPDRNVIPISPATFLSNGYDTAAAYGGGWYAVANSEDGKLKVSFFQDLTLIDTYTIEDQGAYAPDITYDASSGLFILVWEDDINEDGTDYDLFAVALDPEQSTDPPVVGVEQWFAYSLAYEVSPSVDCNPNAGSCLFVWEYDDLAGTTRIEGCFLNVDQGGLKTPSFVFPISTADDSSTPNVAFGGSYYLVIYSFDDGKIWPAYSHVHPTYQTVGNQYTHNTAVMIKPGELNDANPKYAESVAYDPCAGVFVASIRYKDSSGPDLLIRAVDAKDIYVWDFDWVANSANDEYGSSISFIEGYDQAGTPPKGAKLVLSYVRGDGTNDEGLFAADLLSNCSSTTPRYDFEFFNKHTLVAIPESSAGSGIYQPAVAGGGFQELLVTWVNYRGSDGKHQTMGMLMDATEKNYLPLVVK